MVENWGPEQTKIAALVGGVTSFVSLCTYWAKTDTSTRYTQNGAESSDEDQPASSQSGPNGGLNPAKGKKASAAAQGSAQGSTPGGTPGSGAGGSAGGQTGQQFKSAASEMAA